MPLRIFILRPDNLGDLVLFSGALRHLRRHWPTAHITLCVRQFGEELFAHCSYVDRIVSFDDVYSATKGYFPTLPRFRGRDRLGAWILRHAPSLTLTRYRCDIAILPIISPTKRYHQMMRRLLAQTHIGICGSTANQSAEDDLVSRSWYSRQWDVSALASNFSEIEANRLFLEFLGVNMQREEFSPEFWTTTQNKHRAEVLIPTSLATITLALAPGVSSSPYKKLPANWFVEVIRNLPNATFRVVLLGSPGDAILNQEVASLLAGHSQPAEILDLTGQTTVCEMIECLRRCDVVLSQDSAALHIATALHKPVVGIMSGALFGRFYPWGDPATVRVVNKRMDCYGCNWRCIYSSIRCLQEIPPADAAKQLQELIAGLPVN